MRKIFFDLFVFILPTALLINISCLTRWTVQIGDCTTDAAGSGFPFLSTGDFYECIPPNSTGDTWISIPNYIINALIKFAIAFLLYFFLLRKIHLTAFKKVMFIVIGVIIDIVGTAFCLLDFFIFQYREWPDNVQIIKMHFMGS